MYENLWAITSRYGNFAEWEKMMLQRANVGGGGWCGLLAAVDGW